MSVGETVEMSDLLRVASDATLARINKCFPGRVEKYDAGRQVADIKPMLKRSYVDDDGTNSYESLPTLGDVPIAFPRGGGYVITYPLAPGDFVWINCSDQSMSEFLASGQESEPSDVRKHHIQGAVAFPGAWPNSQAIQSADSTMQIGLDGGLRVVIADNILLGAEASDFVALATKVLTELQTIVTAFNAHTHTLTTLTSPTSVPVTPMPPPNPVAAEKVKAN